MVSFSDKEDMINIIKAGVDLVKNGFATYDSWIESIPLDYKEIAKKEFETYEDWIKTTPTYFKKDKYNK